MTDKNGNIDFWIGRVLMIFFFLFMLSFSQNDSFSSIESSSISVGKVGVVNNTATLTESVSFPNYNIALENCVHEDLNSWSSVSNLWISNHSIEQQFKTEEERFY